jgi:predicted DNA-binding transcriptional regulator AlpA
MVIVDFSRPVEAAPYGYEVVARVTAHDDGRVEVWDPQGLFAPDARGRSLLGIRVPLDGQDENGRWRSLGFEDDPAEWLRHVHEELRSGRLVATTVRDDALVELTRSEVSARLNVKEDTWSGYVSRGQAPKPVRRVGHSPVWLAGDVDSWQRSRLGRGRRRQPVA